MSASETGGSGGARGETALLAAGLFRHHHEDPESARDDPC